MIQSLKIRNKQIKKWFDIKQIPYTVIDVAKHPEKKKAMRKSSGSSKLPQVFIDQDYIGGYDEIEDWIEDECLLQALVECGWVPPENFKMTSLPTTPTITELPKDYKPQDHDNMFVTPKMRAEREEAAARELAKREGRLDEYLDQLELAKQEAVYQRRVNLGLVEEVAPPPMMDEGSDDEVPILVDDSDDDAPVMLEEDDEDAPILIDDDDDAPPPVLDDDDDDLPPPDFDEDDDLPPPIDDNDALFYGHAEENDPFLK
eukprot:CAMPEP_0117428856 /NCGR_PEP_ID=MMETSP0758-20121206/8468_1 /TAXON_ID=63605 /ORGANISM="Percolomonas cosmopolitus, Strain AE-1 (ATCC 50343)" /LENGTH=258 /DNA_ID=CAMNT_0005215439 /DNA_START=73 /DNA_END=847 /DNA_ORIENTATION=+